MQVKRSNRSEWPSSASRAHILATPKTEVVLWAAESERADRLQRDLNGNGYSVVRFFSCAASPTLQIDKSIFSGYEEITVVTLSCAD